MPKDLITYGSPKTLDDLARRIDEEHEAAQIRHACGRACDRVRTAAGRSQSRAAWRMPWLRENTKVSERTDRRWMRFAENSETLPAKPATVAELRSCEEQTRIRAGLLFGGQRRVVQTLCRRRRYATCFTGGSAKSTRHANISRKQTHAWLLMRQPQHALWSSKNYTSDGVNWH